MSQPKIKMVMVSLERRDLAASKRDLTTVRARALVLRRNCSWDKACCVSPSVFNIAYCQAAEHWAGRCESESACSHN